MDQEMQYGFQEENKNLLDFGLNSGKAFLKTFKWIPNGGKEGAEQEALDIVFEVNGTTISHRLFPVTKAFDKEGEEITDPKAPEFSKLAMELSQMVTHILLAFSSKESLMAKMAKPVTGFKSFAELAMSTLPKGFEEVPLDIFLQWQWQPKGDSDRVYLEIPKNMKHGKWLVASGKGKIWKVNKIENPLDSERNALFYTDQDSNIHPFTRKGWYMKSNFANPDVNKETENSTTTSEVSEATEEDKSKLASWD